MTFLLSDCVCLCLVLGLQRLQREKKGRKKQALGQYFFPLSLLNTLSETHKWINFCNLCVCVCVCVLVLEYLIDLSGTSQLQILLH